MNSIEQARKYTPRSAEEIDVSSADYSSTDPFGLYVGTGGDVAVDMYQTGTNITFAAVPAGTILPILAVKVYNTGTDASNIVALR